MKKILASLLLIFGLNSFFVFGYDLNSSDKAVGDIIYSKVNEFLVQRGMNIDKFRTELVSTLDGFRVSRFDLNSRPYAIIGYVIDLYLPKISTGLSSTGLISTGTVSTGNLSGVNLSGTTKSSNINPDGQCYSGILISSYDSGHRYYNVSKPGMFTYSGLVSFSAILDGNNCYFVSVSSDSYRSNYEYLVLSSDGIEVSRGVRSFYNLQRISGVFSDYFVLPITIPSISTFGTGIVNSLVSGTGVVVLHPTSLYKLYKNYSDFEGQTYTGLVVKFTGPQY